MHSYKKKENLRGLGPGGLGPSGLAVFREQGEGEAGSGGP